VSTLEDRLQAELRTESELIEGVPELRLPGSGRPWHRPGRARRRWPAWVTPLAAAAAVLAVVIGTLTAVRTLSGPAAHSPAGATSGAAVTLSGGVTDYTSGGTRYSSSVPGRAIQVRATATGAVVATVHPPAPYNDFAVLTGTPDGRTFVFGAERYWGFRGTKSPLSGALDPAAPLRFVLLHVSPDGVTRWSALSMPVNILPGQQPSIALSPDGTRLAVAYGGGGQAALLRVVTLATGQDVTWQWPHVSWTPLIQGHGHGLAGQHHGRRRPLAADPASPGGPVRARRGIHHPGRQRADRGQRDERPRAVHSQRGPGLVRSLRRPATGPPAARRGQPAGRAGRRAGGAIRRRPAARRGRG
jgi:hypothetical protein